MSEPLVCFDIHPDVQVSRSPESRFTSSSSSHSILFNSLLTESQPKFLLCFVQPHVLLDSTRRQLVIKFWVIDTTRQHIMATMPDNPFKFQKQKQKLELNWIEQVLRTWTYPTPNRTKIELTTNRRSVDSINISYIIYRINIIGYIYCLYTYI